MPYSYDVRIFVVAVRDVIIGVKITDALTEYCIEFFKLICEPRMLSRPIVTLGRIDVEFADRDVAKFPIRKLLPFELTTCSGPPT